MFCFALSSAILHLQIRHALGQWSLFHWNWTYIRPLAEASDYSL